MIDIFILALITSQYVWSCGDTSCTYFTPIAFLQIYDGDAWKYCDKDIFTRACTITWHGTNRLPTIRLNVPDDPRPDCHGLSSFQHELKHVKYPKWDHSCNGRTMFDYDCYCWRKPN